MKVKWVSEVLHIIRGQLNRHFVKFDKSLQHNNNSQTVNVKYYREFMPYINLYCVWHQHGTKKFRLNKTKLL